MSLSLEEKKKIVKESWKSTNAEPAKWKVEVEGSPVEVE